MRARPIPASLTVGPVRPPRRRRSIPRRQTENAEAAFASAAFWCKTLDSYGPRSTKYITSRAAHLSRFATNHPMIGQSVWGELSSDGGKGCKPRGDLYGLGIAISVCSTKARTHKWAVRPQLRFC